MLKLSRFTIALAIAGLAAPAFAGSWPNLPSSKGGIARTHSPVLLAASGLGENANTLEEYRGFRNEENERPAFVVRPAAATSTPAPAATGYAYRTAETGWEVTQHKYVLDGGRFAHSSECDHAMRMVERPTAEEVETFRAGFPGG